MQHATHHSQKFGNTELFIFESHTEYFQWLKDTYGIEHGEIDENGNFIEKTDYSDWNDLMGAPHFSDEQPTIQNLIWEACTGKPSGDLYDQLGMKPAIICIINRRPHTISMTDIIGVIGHEYSHILNMPEHLTEATAPYNTDEGYEQEERKAVWFEDYTTAVYQISKMYLDMFAKLGITRRRKKSK